MSDARARLYVIPASHACRAAMLMLEHKRIPYRLVTLPTGAHSLIVRVLAHGAGPADARRGGYAVIAAALSAGFA